ncbi:MAG TPA: cytochrome C oxidase subunit IV family protein [Rhizomicrobium sp.]|jgi:cytochrome c oxidase subunit IV
MEHEAVHPAGQQALAAPHPDSKQGQQHPLGIYFTIWALLFVLSTFSFLVDYFHFQGFQRWALIVIFMWLKAGLIVAIFMHMRWERLALKYAILIPPLLLAVLVSLMSIESNYTYWTRVIFFGLFGRHPA